MSSPIKILMLEDDGESMIPLREYLESRGWVIELTANAALLNRIAEERYDLLLVDLMIHPDSQDSSGEKIHNIQYPGVDWKKTGLEFLKRFRRGEYQGKEGQGTPPDTPVIILSAVANETAEEELNDIQQANRYIEKPYRLSMLQKAIEDLLKGA